MTCMTLYATVHVKECILSKGHLVFVVQVSMQKGIQLFEVNK